GKNALSMEDVSVHRCTHGAARGTFPDLDLVEIRTIPHRNASGAARAADKLEKRMDRQTLEATADLAVATQTRLDADARPQDLADARENGPRIALLSQVGRGRGPELARPLKMILLPRQEDDGRVPEHDVVFQRAREREAVEFGHEDVAHDQLGG